LKYLKDGINELEETVKNTLHGCKDE